MATLTLTQLWVNSMVTGEGIGAYSTDRSRSTEVNGSVRSYAGGRRRAYTTPGLDGKYPFTMRMLTRAQVDTLITWEGSLVQVRNHRGQRFVGIYFSVKEAEYKDSIGTYDASMELTDLTFVDGV